MGQPDAELMQRWQRGELSAFEELVRRWQQPMARFLTRQVGHADRTPDLCQELFLRLFQAGSRYREEGAFSTWLYGIALNVARDAMRRDKHLPLSLNNHEVPAKVAPTGSLCEKQEWNGALLKVLAELPPDMREVIVLRHEEGLNFEQIARMLDVPASTLKSRFAVALNRLRARLAQLGFDKENQP
jgi:RNA polymerase sigma-70 factor (ECF subfamily)